jgi:hypothetical protein
MTGVSAIASRLPTPRVITIAACLAVVAAVAITMAASAGLFGERPELSAQVDFNTENANGKLESLVTLVNQGPIVLEDLRLEVTSGSHSFARGNGVALKPQVRCDAVLQLGVQERFAANCWSLKPGESLDIRILHFASEIDDLTLRAKAHGFRFQQTFQRPQILTQEAVR